MQRASSDQRYSERLRRVHSIFPALLRREIRARYRRSVLNVAWAIVTPLALLAVYGVILTQSFDVSGKCAPYLVTAWLGLVIWTTFASAVSAATASLAASSDLITKIYFPREAVPLAAAGSSVLDFIVGFASVLVLAWFHGGRFGVTMVSAVLPLLVLLVWCASLGVLLSILAVFSRDVVHGVNLALRVGFFATPVMYESSLLPGIFRWSADVNPVAVVIDGFRLAVLCGQWPNLPLLAVHLAAGVVLLILVISYTRAIEGRLADVA